MGAHGTGKCRICGRRLGLTKGRMIPPHLDTRTKGKSGYPDDCPGAGDFPERGSIEK